MPNPTTTAAPKPGPEVNKQYPKSEWEYVEVPEKDMLGANHGGVSLNGVHYATGKHFVPPDIAKELNRILRMKDRADVRIIQPNPDLNALTLIARRAPAAFEPLES